MSITPFGLLFLPIVVLVFTLRTTWLVPLLVVSAALHAPAVAVFGVGEGQARIGISPWLVVSFAALLHLVLLAVQRRRIEVGQHRAVIGLLIGWTLFAAWGVVSAFVMPFVFEGTSTYNSEHVLSLWEGPEPLRWRFINAVQAANLAIAWLLLLYVLQVARAPGFLRRLVIGLIAAGLLAVVLSLAGRLMLSGWIPPSELIDRSLNPSYHQTLGFTPGSLLRVGWPFSEPSYASVWFAGFYSAGLGLALFSRHLGKGLALAGLSLLGSLNSLGGSGIASLIICTLTQCLAAFAAAILAQGALRRAYALRLASIVVMFGLLGVAALNLQRFDQFKELNTRNFYEWIVLPRLTDHKHTIPSRGESNRVALRVIAETHGVGVGLGSNRASSYALNLASSLGVLAALLFFGLLARQAWLLFRFGRGSTPRLFLLFGALGMLCGVVAGIPDLLWPAWWIWIIAMFAAVAYYVPGPASKVPAPASPASDDAVHINDG